MNGPIGAMIPNRYICEEVILYVLYQLLWPSYQLLTALLVYVSRQDNWPINITFNLRTPKIFNYHSIQLTLVLLQSYKWLQVQKSTKNQILIKALDLFSKHSLIAQCEYRVILTKDGLQMMGRILVWIAGKNKIEGTPILKLATFKRL